MRPLEHPRPVLPRRCLAFLAGLFAALGLSACGAGSYIWVDDLGGPDAPALSEETYVIASGDLLNIRVYQQETISTRARVSPDGKIAVPLVDEIEARGRTPASLAKQIAARLKPFIVAPSVAITVEEPQPLKISVLGEVAHPGVFATTPGTGVLQALALAGGVTEFADRDGVFVLRTRPAKGVLRIRIGYRDLMRGAGRSAAFLLESGDTVVVE